MNSYFFKNVVRGVSKTTQNNCNQFNKSQVCQLSDNSMKFVPAKKLVGIELNPGPQKRSGGKGRKRPNQVLPSSKAAKRLRKVTRPGMSLEVIEEITRQVGRSKRSKRMKRAKGRGGKNPAYLKARFGMGMQQVTDGINTMKTIHNGSVIEDTFAVRREKIANVIGFTNTTLQLAQTFGSNLYLNPGNTVLFPIFSQIAATYEQYRVNELIFSYETEAYTASGTNVSAGKVILATNYDPSDNNFSTDTQMENYFNSDRGAPYCEIIHDVLQGDHNLKHDSLKNYYVNPSANLIAPVNDSTQNKFYDVGSFQLGCQGNASSSAEIGELYVTYSFTMIRPKQQTPTGQNLLSTHIVSSGVSTATAAAPLGTTGGVLRAGSNIPSVCTTTTFTLPVIGRFTVSCSWVAASIAAIPVLTPGANIITSATTLLQNNTNYTNSSYLATGTASTGIWYYDVTTAGTGAANTITLSGNTAMSGGNADIFISQVPSGLGLAIAPSLSNVNEEVDNLRTEMEDMKRLIFSLQKTLVSEPSTPHTYTEDDLSTSIHIPRSALSALFGASSSSSRK